MCWGVWVVSRDLLQHATVRQQKGHDPQVEEGEQGAALDRGEVHTEGCSRHVSIWEGKGRLGIGQGSDGINVVGGSHKREREAPLYSQGPWIGVNEQGGRFIGGDATYGLICCGTGNRKQCLTERTGMCL